MTELQRLARRLADDYQFECQGGPLRNCMEWRALCAAIDTLAVPPPPSGASPQEPRREHTDACQDNFDRLTIGRPAIEQACICAPQEPTGGATSPQAETCGAKKCARPDCGHFECQHVEYIGGAYEGNCRDCFCQEFVAPVSPASPQAETNEDRRLADVREACESLGLVPGATISSVQRALHVNAPTAMRLLSIREAIGAPVSPVEPTPASSNTPAEPETCEWRIGTHHLAKAPCFDSPWFGRHAVATWNGCPYCLKPLRLVPSEETK